MKHILQRLNDIFTLGKVSPN